MKVMAAIKRIFGMESKPKYSHGGLCPCDRCLSRRSSAFATREAKEWKQGYGVITENGPEFIEVKGQS